MYSENDFYRFFDPDNKTPVPERKKYSPYHSSYLKCCKLIVILNFSNTLNFFTALYH